MFRDIDNKLLEQLDRVLPNRVEMFEMNGQRLFPMYVTGEILNAAGGCFLFRRPLASGFGWGSRFAGGALPKPGDPPIVDSDGWAYIGVKITVMDRVDAEIIDKILAAAKQLVAATEPTDAQQEARTEAAQG